MSKRKQVNRALLDAVLSGQLVAIVALLDQGADIETRDREHGETPLMLAMLLRKTSIAAELVQRGANVNAQSDQGRTPLMYAVQSASLDAARKLLEQGANCSILDANGDDALTFAVHSADIEIVRLLREHPPCLTSEAVERAKRVAQSWGLTAIGEMLSAAESR